MKNFTEFSENLLDFLVKKERTFNEDEKDVCTNCPAWCNRFCIIPEIWNADEGLTCRKNVNERKATLIDKK